MHKLITTILFATYLFTVLIRPVEADLSVDTGEPPGDPIFTLTNMAPGDSVVKTITITNDESVPQMVAVKGVRTGPDGEEVPFLENVIKFTITGNMTFFSGTLSEFFTDSSEENGILLSALDGGESKTYTFEALFPTSAGNEFQAKSVSFDLIFGDITVDHLVINEVYYKVADDKGLDSAKDRGILDISGNNATISVQDNAAGSVNSAQVDIRESCLLLQQNSANIKNFADVASDTGGNTGSSNVNTNVTISSGSSNVFVSIFNRINMNIASMSCNRNRLAQNHEWVELYNPTDETINLRNYSLQDNSGETTPINRWRRIRPKRFALISKSFNTWRYWNESFMATKIYLGHEIGDGLDNDGDHLILKDPSGEPIDAVGWGTDTAIWDPAVPDVTLGSSIQRLFPGLDTDMPDDWQEKSPPTPGT